MPLPAPNLYPAFNTVRLSHACFGVSDLAASRKFYADTLGLQVTDEDDSRIYLRAMEERGHHCVILEKSDEITVKVHWPTMSMVSPLKGEPLAWKLPNWT